jgi:phosphopantothenoylcysteine synthetase/decarboxylase
MKLPILAAAALLVSTTYLSAQTFTEKVIEQLQEQGFEITEVENGNGVIRVEAIRDGKSRELVYNNQTGKLLKDEFDGEDRVGGDSDDEDLNDDGDHEQLGDDDSNHDSNDDDGNDDSDDDGGHDDGGDDDGGDDD